MLICQYFFSFSYLIAISYSWVFFFNIFEPATSMTTKLLDDASGQSRKLFIRTVVVVVNGKDVGMVDINAGSDVIVKS